MKPVYFRQHAREAVQLPEERTDPAIDAQRQEINITQGGEFLDDLIRTREQPLFEKQK
jgi:hypothetical protein